MRIATLRDKVSILTDRWPVVVVRERGALSAEERRCAMVTLSAAVLGRGGLYGLVLDFQDVQPLSALDRELVEVFVRAAGHNCGAVAALTQPGAGSVSAMLWARALGQSVVLVGAVPEGIRLCRRLLGLSPVKAVGPADLGA